MTATKLGALLLALAVPPSAASLSDPCDASLRVNMKEGALVDACGRLRFFRGINMVYKTPPYYASPTSFSGDGNSLTTQDGAMMQSLGWNGLRLGVMWSGTVPQQRGVVNATYLQILSNITSSLYEQFGVWSLLDAHQDLFSEAFCADGAPRWAAYEYAQGAQGPFPEPLGRAYPVPPTGQNCSQLTWGAYYATFAVGRAFQTLYNTTTGQADFAAFWSAVVSAFSATNGVLGYEALNEPWAGDAFSNPLLMVPGMADASNLQPFYEALAPTIRAAEAASGCPAPRVIYYEPVTWDNFVPAGFGALPEAAQGLAGLSYHYYSLPDVVGIKEQAAARNADGVRLGALPFLTEFDVDLPAPVNAPYTELDLRATLDTADVLKHGYLGWAYSSVFEGGNGSVVVDALRELARPFPMAIAGTNASWLFNATLQTFSLTYTLSPGASAAAPTVVFLSTGFWFPAASLQVEVTTVPPGAVAFTVEHHPGATVPLAGGPALVPAQAFAYARLVITPTASGSGAAAAAAAAAGAVTVDVNVGVKQAAAA